jgi:hypothetical protein
MPPKSHKTQPIAISFSDGHVVIMQWLLDPHLEGDLARTERAPDVKAIQRDIDKTLWPPEHGPVVGWRLIQQEDIPQDRDYRNAWIDRGDKIDHDMPKAREIHRQKLRSIRADLWPGLDVEYHIADEYGDTAAKMKVAGRKKALRDITADPAIDAAQTVEELKSVIPDSLKE